MPPEARTASLTAAVAVLALVLLMPGALDALAQGHSVRRAASAASCPAAGRHCRLDHGQAGGILQSPCARSCAAKADGSAVWGLLGLSFLYGIFHAAGPGHGKAVISSYVVANEETWRRGVVLSFASALLQAFVAVAIVGVAAWAVQRDHREICDARALDRDRRAMR